MAVTASAITKATPSSSLSFCLRKPCLRFEPLERRKKFIRGRLPCSITEPSPLRVAAPCPHFGVCGGCHYQHIPSYRAQLQFKSDILRETLSRLGRITWDGPIVPHGSPAYGYRNRAQWKIAQAPAGTADAGALSIGYYQSGSQKLCPVRECPILSPRLAEALAALSGLVRAGDLPANLREVEAFTDEADANLLLNLAFDRLLDAPEQTAAKLRAALPGIETLLLHDRRADHFELVGPGYLSYRVGDANYPGVGHLSFFQVNRFLLPGAGEPGGAGGRSGQAGARSVCRRGAVCRSPGTPFSARRRRGVQSSLPLRDLRGQPAAERRPVAPNARESAVETFLAALDRKSPIWWSSIRPAPEYPPQCDRPSGL